MGVSDLPCGAWCVVHESLSLPGWSAQWDWDGHAGVGLVRASNLIYLAAGIQIVLIVSCLMILTLYGVFLYCIYGKELMLVLGFALELWCPCFFAGPAVHPFRLALC